MRLARPSSDLRLAESSRTIRVDIQQYYTVAAVSKESLELEIVPELTRSAGIKLNSLVRLPTARYAYIIFVSLGSRRDGAGVFLLNSMNYFRSFVKCTSLQMILRSSPIIASI